ncbi:MAG: putative signal transducing protein [Thermoanaerobaculaceae bacterium]
MCPEPSDEVIDTGEVVVARVQGFLEADTVLAALRANGIQARSRGDAMGELAGLTLDGIGLTEILVPPEHAEAARDLLAAAERGELELADSETEPGPDRG